jgi:ABC-type transport system substrate-binding protein
MSVKVASDGDQDPVANYYLGLLKSLGYRATLRDDNVSNTGTQLGHQWWGVDFAAPSDFWGPLLSCASFDPHSAFNINWGGYCNQQVDALARKALDAQYTDPALARRLWTQVDHVLTDDAPWVAGPVARYSTVVSSRVGNYQANPVLGPLIDQMWVQ